eukprot:TRINITY_DN8899_c0_g1_i1.p1 TRINITY_DN8899_c0_g1~~TRINITY_DN8899_c0_g1_i1.p1  ORF type:complete len:237 (+),score=23.80 TRINITY_DN8899_c0_g1_i1:40-711(+)
MKYSNSTILLLLVSGTLFMYVAFSQQPTRSYVVTTMYANENCKNETDTYTFINRQGCTKTAYDWVALQCDDTGENVYQLSGCSENCTTCTKKKMFQQNTCSNSKTISCVTRFPFYPVERLIEIDYTEAACTNVLKWIVMPRGCFQGDPSIASYGLNMCTTSNNITHTVPIQYACEDSACQQGCSTFNQTLYTCESGYSYRCGSGYGNIMSIMEEEDMIYDTEL